MSDMCKLVLMVVWFFGSPYVLMAIYDKVGVYEEEPYSVLLLMLINIFVCAAIIGGKI